MTACRKLEEITSLPVNDNVSSQKKNSPNPESLIRVGKSVVAIIEYISFLRMRRSWQENHYSRRRAGERYRLTDLISYHDRAASRHPQEPEPPGHFVAVSNVITSVVVLWLVSLFCATFRILHQYFPMFTFRTFCTCHKQKKYQFWKVPPT